MLKRLAGAIGLALALIAGTQSSAKAEDLRIAFGTDVTAINALDSVTGPSRVMTDHIAEGLVRWINGEIIPWLATGWTNVDPVTWEFKLRPNVKFHNGEPFNAEVVKATFEAILNEANKSPYRPSYQFIKEVQVVDDLTVRIVTKTPYSALLSLLPQVSMIPPKYFAEVGADGYRKKPVGTGPYRFVEHVRDDHATIQASPDYWGGPQRFQRIIYRPIPEAAARVSALLAGEVDFVADIPPELKPMFDGRNGTRLIIKRSPRFYLFMVNNKKPEYPTTKREVREAIAYAINRQALASEVLEGTAAPVSWQIPDTLGEDPNAKPLAYDPKKAKQLLAQAGYPNGLDITMDTPTGRYLKDRELADAIAGQMGQAGFRVNVRTAEWGVIIKSVYTGETAPIILLAWGTGDRDPDQFNRGVLSSKGMFSQTNYPELDALVTQIASEMDPDKRRELIAKQRAFEGENFPVIYILQLGLLGGVSEKLKGWDMQADERYMFYQNNVAVK